MTELLTDLEKEALAHLSKASGCIRKICDPEQANYPYDWAEMAHSIHHLQRTIMSQAAVRAYPEEFRGLGKIEI